MKRACVSWPERITRTHWPCSSRRKAWSRLLRISPITSARFTACQGNFKSALDEYQKAIDKDANFAPAFLGRALANLDLNPQADVTNDLNEAINLDPHYAEAYIERGKYRLPGNPAAAESDFEAAIEITPDSALAYLYLADAQLALGENDAALQSAQRANQIDMTLIPVYLALAQAYIATGQSEQAIGVLQTYTIYAPNDSQRLSRAGDGLQRSRAISAGSKYPQ